MPNHCENDLWLQGSDADVAAVLRHIGADNPAPVFDFNTIIPYPEPFKTMDEDKERMGLEHDSWPLLDDPERDAKLEERNRRLATYKEKWGTASDGYNSGGYEWCRANWGTKWGAYEVARRDYDRRVCITFQTAWGPPAPVIVALARLFPTVTFTVEYFECGMGFAGGFCCPSEEWWYKDESWRPGVMVNEWQIDNYCGARGG